MVIVLLRFRLRPDADVAAYEQLNDRMEELAQESPGYLGSVGFRDADGADVAIIRFESEEALREWRRHPEHRVAQRRGREEFFSSYDIEVCDLRRAYSFPRPPRTPTADPAD